MKAQFPSRCFACNGKIKTGDDIQKTGLYWSHTLCPSVAFSSGTCRDKEEASK